MADKHPYISSGGPIIQVLQHLRSSFPRMLDAATLKKLGFASNNERYVLSILRFLEIIDEEGKKTDQASKIFALHDNKEFANNFSEVIKKSYNELFALHGKNTWQLEPDGLITFFRNADQTSAIVGKRQANTFIALARFSGQREVATARASVQRRDTKKPSEKKKATQQTRTRIAPSSTTPPGSGGAAKRNESDVGLTVRIEINLPSDGNQETYDRIFRSIRENLLNGE